MSSAPSFYGPEGLGKTRQVAIAGGWLALRLTGSLNWLFAALALGLVLHGLTLVVAIGTGAWFRNPSQRIPAPAA